MKYYLYSSLLNNLSRAKNYIIKLVPQIDNFYNNLNLLYYYLISLFILQFLLFEVFFFLNQYFNDQNHFQMQIFENQIV